MSGYSNQEEEEELLLLQQPTTVDSPCAAAHSHLPCTNCGYCGVSPGISLKRRSTEPPSSVHDCEQPKHKKPNKPLSIHGFSKIPLPTQDQPLLRRCSSDHNNNNNPPTVVTNTAAHVSSDPPQSPPKNSEISRPETPFSVARSSAANKLPPRPPTLMRSVSDPNPSPSSSCVTAGGYESPNDKRLRRMRDCIREMNKGWDEILPPEVEEDAGTAADCSKADMEECVSVERAGEYLTIHFKCPCGNGYQILLSGRNCYYKLI